MKHKIEQFTRAYLLLDQFNTRLNRLEPQRYPTTIGRQSGSLNS